MKENYDLDQIDYIQTNNPFQSKTKQNISSIQNIQETNQITILLHFSSTKAFSFVIPNTWTTKKLISFILTTFKSEIRNSIPVIFYKGNLMQTFSETVLKDYLDPVKLNHIIITLKEKDKNISKEENKENKDNNIDNNNNNKKNILDNIYSKSNKEVFKTEEFCDMEKYVMNDYTKIFKEDSLMNFPLMSPAYNSRREQIKYDSQTERLSQFEPIPLEDFPLKNYFQLKIIFKCIISFFALGIYIKGFNFILFLFVLVIYYWYCINNIIEDFYKKKFQEIGLSDEEYKRLGVEIKDLGKKLGSFSFDKDDNEEGEEEEESDNENDKNNNEDIIYEENTDENKNKNNNININKEANNKINIDFEEDIKEINTNLTNDKNNIITEPMKDLEFKEDNKNNDNSQINNDIKHLEKKKRKKDEKKEEKKENEPEEIEEPERETPLQIAYQIIYVFFISFIPPWCDEFEAQNPMPANNPPNQNENNVNNIEENQNNINNENNINNDNNINNNNIFNNINNEINDNNIGQDPLNLPPQENDSNNNKMTSSKVANISEDSNRDNRMFNLIKKDNQSLNENEYVFSENGGIDSLSMNSELFRQKKEKEKEKEKENKDNKEIKEKEKEIFEVEEEDIIEEDKHLKNE